MTARSWIRNLFFRTPRTIRKQPARWRPILETLEQRLAPATIIVNSTLDNTNFPPATVTLAQVMAAGATVSLRDAVDAANNTTGGSNTIQFEAGLSDPIDLSTSESGQGTLTLSQDVTIDGSGASITIEGGSTPGSTSNARPVVVNSGVTATLENLTISNGYTTGFGGAINNGGRLTVSNCTLSNNSATQQGGGPGGDGGGIFNGSGTLTVTNCTLSGNSADFGGAIDNSDTYNTTTQEIVGAKLTVSNSTLSNNSAAHGNGGGICNNGGTLTVSNSTLSNNSATGQFAYGGGGIFNYYYEGEGGYHAGTGTVSNCTLSGNSATGQIANGGGICNFATLTVSDSTLSGNSAGDGIANDVFKDTAGTVTLNNTIVANNSGGDISNSGTLAGSHNLIGDGSGGSGLKSTITGDPKLGPLAYNGGPTQTMALQSGSPAIDKGDNSLIANDPTTTEPYEDDQRGMNFNRVVGSSVDIGAFEVQPTDSTVALTASPGPSVYGQAVTITADVSLTLSGTQATAGTITFLDGNTVLQSGVPVSGGQATYSTTALTAGTHNLLAVYSGVTGSFLPAAGTTSQVVNAATPTLGSATSANITASTATLGGTVISDGGASISQRGVLYSTTNSNLTLTNSNLSQVYDSVNTTGSFTEYVTGLSANTTYYFVAFATNSLGTTYTSPVSTFTTAEVQFSTASETVIQSAGTFSITVTLSAASSQDVSVPFTQVGSAVIGTDYSGITASPLTIKAGQTSATITGALPADPGASPTLTFTLGTPAHAALGATTVNTLTITEPPALNVPGPQTPGENVALAIPGITVGASQGDSLTVKLSVTYGTLTVVTTTGLTVPSKKVTLTGTSTYLNSVLATLTYLGGHDSTSSDMLNISVSDNSNSLSTSGSVAITVESPAQQAAALQAQVAALGFLNQGQANSLIVKLNLNGTSGDISKVQSFIQELDDLIAAGNLTPAQANALKALLGPANNLLLSVTRR
jgi:hypothetical protein